MKDPKKIVPKTDPLFRKLCSDEQDSCKLIQEKNFLYKVIERENEVEICVYQEKRIIESTSQEEKVSIPPGVKLKQEAHIEREAIGCVSIPREKVKDNTKVSDLPEIKALIQKQERK